MKVAVTTMVMMTMLAMMVKRWWWWYGGDHGDGDDDDDDDGGGGDGDDDDDYDDVDDGGGDGDGDDVLPLTNLTYSFITSLDGSGPSFLAGHEKKKKPTVNHPVTSRQIATTPTADISFWSGCRHTHALQVELRTVREHGKGRYWYRLDMEVGLMSSRHADA